MQMWYFWQETPIEFISQRNPLSYSWTQAVCFFRLHAFLGLCLATTIKALTLPILHTLFSSVPSSGSGTPAVLCRGSRLGEQPLLEMCSMALQVFFLSFFQKWKEVSTPFPWVCAFKPKFSQVTTTSIEALWSVSPKRQRIRSPFQIQNLQLMLNLIKKYTTFQYK